MAAEPFVRSLGDFLEADIEPEELILEPWLPVRGLAMLAGVRGIGKTFLAVACAMAIAGGGSVLGWRAAAPRGVLYVDGEMSLTDMQARAVATLAGLQGVDREEALRNLYFLCDADQEKGIPNLIENASSHRMIEATLALYGLEVLILDNLSALCNSAAENDVESWTVMQDWLLSLRRKGYTVIFLHHTGKANDAGFYKQRGTSKREDVLNSSLLLVPVKKQDNSFQVVFTKHRGFLPEHDLRGTIVLDETKKVCRIVQGKVAPKPATPDVSRFVEELG